MSKEGLIQKVVETSEATYRRLATIKGCLSININLRGATIEEVAQRLVDESSVKEDIGYVKAHFPAIGEDLERKLKEVL